MRLAVLLHEEPPERVPGLLEQAGLLSVAPFVTAVIAGFGKLWKLGGGAIQLARYCLHSKRPGTRMLAYSL